MIFFFFFFQILAVRAFDQIIIIGCHHTQNEMKSFFFSLLLENRFRFYQRMHNILSNQWSACIFIHNSQFLILYALSWPLNLQKLCWQLLFYIYYAMCSMLTQCLYNKHVELDLSILISWIESIAKFGCRQCYKHNIDHHRIESIQQSHYHIHININEIHIVHRYGSWILIKSDACVSLLCLVHLWIRRSRSELGLFMRFHWCFSCIFISHFQHFIQLTEHRIHKSVEKTPQNGIIIMEL